ncbi:60S ribosomal protein L5-1 [Capsicum annuum]|nr:60S ribosomal protein L5-1 [Capsicum annuum]
MYSIRLQRSLYGLKQSGHILYNRLSEYLSKEVYSNAEIYPCVFIKKTMSEFVILTVYVDDINLIGTPIELQKAIDYLKKEFEMKDLDPFRPQEKNEELLSPEIPYLSTIGALMYLANTTRPDIPFSVNLLARYSSAPTRRHLNGIKHILRYLKGTTDMGLFYPKDCSSDLVGYADVGYLFDPHKARSQTGYVFICGGTVISWRSTKQSIVTTSSNHAEIIAIHEASREPLSKCRRLGLTLSVSRSSSREGETNKDIIAQIVSASIAGDMILASAYASELSHYGLKVGLTNYAAAYCTGLLLARRVLKKLEMDVEYQGNLDVNGEDYSVEPAESRRPFRALLDVGLIRTTTGNRVFGALKGALDGGIDIPHSEKRFAGFSKDSKQLDAEVHRKYIYGGHVAAYMNTLMEDEPEKYQSHFSMYLKSGVEPDNIEEMYKKVHAAIRADPSPKKSGKQPPKQHKRYNLKKLTYEERKARLIERLNALNAAGGNDDDDEEDDD